MALNVYRGKIQSERPVNATRIKDQLYMFTGTYPLYYKGDGKLYLMPEHQTTFNEAVVAGHNTFMRNFDNYYYRDKADLTLEQSSNINSTNDLFVRSFDFTPLLPYTENFEESTDLTLQASFSLPLSRFTEGNNELKVTAYYRSSAPGAAPDDYIEVPRQSFQFFTVNGGPPLGSSLTLNSSTQNQINNIYFEGSIGGVGSGLKDILFEFEILTFNGNSYDPKYLSLIELPEITFTVAKISDYPTEEFPDRGNFKLEAPWSCNQVTEHYGQLIAWGSNKMPSTLFISNNQNLNYFPSLYTLTFETDAREAINAVTPFMNILVIQSDSYTWGLKGKSPLQYLDNFAEVPNPNAYQAFSINSSIGAIAPKSIRPVRNRLYFLSEEGLMELTSLFATDDRYNVKPLDRNIINLIPQDREAVGIQFDNQYWVNFPSTGETFRYYIDKEAWVKDTYNFDLFNGFYKFKNKDGKLHIVTHPLVITNPETGVPQYRIFETKVREDIVSDLEKPIITKFLTSKMHQEYPFHWKRYKEFKLDFGIQNEFIIDDFIPYSGDNDLNPYTITANFLANHTYAVALNVDPSYNSSTQTFSYPSLSNLQVENASHSSYSNGIIYFTIGNKDVEDVGIRADNLQLSWFTGSLITDETYDKNLSFKVNIVSDNKSLIPEVDIATDYQPYNLNLVSEELGIMANTFEDTFENSQFGKSYKFVHTNKLQGSGYDIALYYEDNSKVKWTLETLGVTYKMRRTRSR